MQERSTEERCMRRPLRIGARVRVLARMFPDRRRRRHTGTVEDRWPAARMVYVLVDDGRGTWLPTRIVRLHEDQTPHRAMQQLDLWRAA